jgi:hypothetical protein
VGLGFAVDKEEIDINFKEFLTFLESKTYVILSDILN